jgi:magnesium transporter
MGITSYLKPKTMIYTGKHDDVKTKITHYQYSTELLEIIKEYEPTKEAKHYIQVVGLSDIEQLKQIRDFYQIDHLVFEDVLNVNQRNKIELTNQYLFGTFNISYLENNQIKNDYLSLIMFKDTIISFHETIPVYLSPLEQLFTEYKELKEKNIDFLLYEILDIITDGHLDVYDHLDFLVNQFEEEILETKNIEQEAFYLIRKQLLRLRNNVSPVFEQLEKIILKKELLFNNDNIPYYDDLKDHLQRLELRLIQSKETTNHLLDLHINNQSNKMNQIMATLTLFSAIFIPLSFLTGFFGMNFVYFEVLSYEYALIFFVAVCAVIAGAMFYIFKKKKWL